MAQFTVPIQATINAKDPADAARLANEMKQMLTQNAVKWALAAKGITLSDVQIGTPTQK